MTQTCLDPAAWPPTPPARLQRQGTWEAQGPQEAVCPQEPLDTRRGQPSLPWHPRLAHTTDSLQAHETESPALGTVSSSGSHHTRFSGGSVSGRKQKRNSKSEAVKSKASQGAVCAGRKAPSMGPSVKPSEKATPMTACREDHLSQEGDPGPGAPGPLSPSVDTHHASAAGRRRAQISNDGRGKTDISLADAANHPGGQEGCEALRGSPHGIRGGQACLPQGRDQGAGVVT